MAQWGVECCGRANGGLTIASKLGGCSCVPTPSLHIFTPPPRALLRTLSCFDRLTARCAHVLSSASVLERLREMVRPLLRQGPFEADFVRAEE